MKFTDYGDDDDDGADVETLHVVVFLTIHQLTQPLTFSSTIQPVSLPAPGQQTAAGTIATVVGWGSVDYTTVVVSDLHKVDVPVWSDEDCQATYDYYVYSVRENNICAGEEGKGKCGLDSGDPLLVNGQLVGIASWDGYECATADSPGVYTEVSYFVDWINQNALKQPLTFNSKIQAITLPASQQQTTAGTTATLVGWGATETSSSSTVDKLRKVDIPVWSDEDCKAAYENYRVLRENNICAGTTGKGQCNGDSGGPLIANGQQIGIVSWSEKPCASEGLPGVFTEVSYFIDWISEHISTK
ncbi:trypsin I-P1-like [Schistocerca piceifrons]|uniref:trypsin I-P1-like n=1 Tax=Schistocerca piceifrons TaxID=274613 RepID=UPI001F5EBC86|nr:trypsin I-P1-like [Schistocerca piceifrons]